MSWRDQTYVVTVFTLKLNHNIGKSLIRNFVSYFSFWILADNKILTIITSQVAVAEENIPRTA